MSNNALIDTLIDNVAHGITSAPVQEGFTRRVSARIEEVEVGAGADRAARLRWRAWLLAPAAAGIALSAAVLIVKHRASLDVRLKPAAATSRPHAAAGPQSGASVEPGAASASVTPPGRGRPANAAARIRRAAAAPPGDADLQPIAMAPIEMASLDISPLGVVRPIEIQAIVFDRIEISAMP